MQTASRAGFLFGFDAGKQFENFCCWLSDENRPNNDPNNFAVRIYTGRCLPTFVENVVVVSVVGENIFPCFTAASAC